MNKLHHKRQRTLFLLMTLVLFGYRTYAGNPLPLTYRLKAYTMLQECDQTGNKLNKPMTTVVGGAKFTLTQPQKNAAGNYILEFWDWNVDPAVKNLRLDAAGNQLSTGTATPLSPDLQAKKAASSNYFEFNYDATTGNSRFFLISDAQLASSAEALVNSFSPNVGAVVMPFKYRPQTGDFTKDITFSGMGGISWNVHQQTHHTVSGLIGVGITSVTLTPKNSTSTENTDRAAVTLSFAALYQWERLQLGILVGADYLGEGSASWVYNKKHWLAAGIGFNIFKPETNDAKDTGKQ
ncbi:hypothetical protein [Hymenobacter glaciei]